MQGTLILLYIKLSKLINFDSSTCDMCFESSFTEEMLGLLKMESFANLLPNQLECWLLTNLIPNKMEITLREYNYPRKFAQWCCLHGALRNIGTSHLLIVGTINHHHACGA